MAKTETRFVRTSKLGAPALVYLHVWRDEGATLAEAHVVHAHTTGETAEAFTKVLFVEREVDEELMLATALAAVEDYVEKFIMALGIEQRPDAIELMPADLVAVGARMSLGQYQGLDDVQNKTRSGQTRTFVKDIKLIRRLEQVDR